MNPKNNNDKTDITDGKSEDYKRKRPTVSSTSELDNSIVEEKALDKQKKKKSKQKGDDDRQQQTMKESEIPNLTHQMNKINSKLEKLDDSVKTVNTKLGNVMVKGDGSIKTMMRDIITEMFTDMKENLLQSITHNMEVLEGKLFERDQECDQLKKEMKELEVSLEDQKSKNESLENEMHKMNENRMKFENQSEQYSRRNNITITGIKDNTKGETALETAKKVVQLMRDKDICDLSINDIDIAHRLPNKANENRQVIVKLISRNTKHDIMKNKSKLKGTGIYLNEDLTSINFEVLMSVKKKMKEEVKDAWTQNGKIFYKSHTDKIYLVKYEDYQLWLEMSWP